MLTLRPLAAALFLASVSGCVIFNIDGGDGGEPCPSLDEVCPNLSCPFGNVVIDGCAICECAESCDPGPQPECANAVVIDCSWVCGAACFSDFDCSPGQVCSRGDVTPVQAEDNDGAPEDAARVAPQGVCIDVEQPCFSDGDCGQGFFCDFIASNSDQGAPDSDEPRSDEDQADPAPPAEPPPPGVCRVNAQCFGDEDCRPGQACEFPDVANGLVAPGGVCVDKVSECETDRDCDEGETCLVECGAIPGCPECDACLFIGTCVAASDLCFADEHCARGEFCDFANAGGARPCFDENGDGQCDDANDFVAPQGVCRPLQTGCSVNEDCPEGQICEAAEDCVCTTECRDDGNGGCLPCACDPATGTGVCVEDPNLNPCASVRCAAGTSCVALPDGTAQCVEDDNRCFSDMECAAGQTCNNNEVCLTPPGCERGQDCPAVCAGFCVDAERTCRFDEDCERGEFCLTDRPGNDCFAPDCANRPAPAPEGVCRPRETDPCLAALCAPGTTCEVERGEAICRATIGECRSNTDCPNGSVCNAGDPVCNPPPGCGPNDACADVCSGFCVEPTR